MNILISKGDNISFGNLSKKKYTYGGVDVAGKMFIHLANLYPQHTFYYIGNCKSQQSDLPNNLINLYILFKENVPKIKNKYNIKIFHYKDVYKYIDTLNLTFDKAIYFFNRSTPLAEWDEGYISKRTGKPRNVLTHDMMYSLPLSIIKHYNVPCYYLIDDLYEINRISSDMQNPAGIWAQYNYIDKSSHHIDLNNVVIRETPVKYKPIETLWLLDKEKVDWRNYEKTNRFVLAVNFGIGRIPYMYNWIFKYMPNQQVLGNFQPDKFLRGDETYDINPNNFVTGAVMDNEELLFNSKYTLVIPPNPTVRSAKHNTAFVTQKVYTMLYYGIIPFWGKYDYDTDYIYNYMPEYLRCETPDEMYAKMEELDNNEQMYRELLYKLYELLEDKYFNGLIVKEIFEEIL